MDAQSVKSTLVSSSIDTGYDSGKRIKGMKRNIIVDTTGMLMCVKVHSAAIADRHDVRLLSACLSRNWKNVKKYLCTEVINCLERINSVIPQLMDMS